jgi:hypothetical protein
MKNEMITCFTSDTKHSFFIRWVLGIDWKHIKNFDGVDKIHATSISSRLLRKNVFMHLCKFVLNANHGFPM